MVPLPPLHSLHLLEANLRIVDPDQQPVVQNVVGVVAQISSPSPWKRQAVRLCDVVSIVSNVLTAGDIKVVVMAAYQEIVAEIKPLNGTVAGDVGRQRH